MSNVKFSQLPNQGALTDATILPTVASGINYTVTGANLKTYVNSTTGNVTAGYFIGNGSQLTGLPATYTNANATALLASFGSNAISTTGNVTAGYFVGNGSLLTGLPASYGNTDVSNYLASGTDLGNIVSQGNVAAAYIIGNGSALTNLNIGPYISTYAGNITGGNISVTGNVYGNIRNATGGYSDANVQGVLQTYSGSFTAGSVSAVGNITGNYFIGNGSQLTGVTTSLGGNMSSNINGQGYSIGNIGTLTATGNVSGTFIGSGSQLTGIPTSISAGPGISVNNSTGAITITNNNPTPYTNANVAAYLSVYTGAVAAGTVSATGNITGSNINGTFFGSGGNLSNVVTSIVAGTGISINQSTGAVTITNTGGAGSYGNANVAAYLASGTANTNIITTSPGIMIAPTAQFTNMTVAQTATIATLSVTGNVTVGGNITDASFDTATLGIATVVTQLNNPSGVFVQAPGTISSSSQSGQQGRIQWDANYIYVCTATNTWKRVALSTF